MAYQREPETGSKRLMTTLVVITIGLVAFWAATGGLEQILSSG